MSGLWDNRMPLESNIERYLQTVSIYGPTLKMVAGLDNTAIKKSLTNLNCWTTKQDKSKNYLYKFSSMIS